MSYSEVERSLKEYNDFLKGMTEYTELMREISNRDKVKELADIRKMPLDTLVEAGVFFIGDMSQMIIPKFISKLYDFGVISPTNNKPIFSERWIFPIKTTDGSVLNLVGYSNTADERYIYGKAKYYLRRDTFYGLENMHIAHELGWAAITEGITDTVRLRSIGIYNSFATCGTHESPTMRSQLNRLKYGIIHLPDRDQAGQKALKNWETFRSIVINMPLDYKDPDEMLREEGNLDIFMEYMEQCVHHLTGMSHGRCLSKQNIVTIL